MFPIAFVEENPVEKLHEFTIQDFIRLQNVPPLYPFLYLDVLSFMCEKDTCQLYEYVSHYFDMMSSTWLDGRVV